MRQAVIPTYNNSRVLERFFTLTRPASLVERLLQDFLKIVLNVLYLGSRTTSSARCQSIELYEERFLFQSFSQIRCLIIHIITDIRTGSVITIYFLNTLMKQFFCLLFENYLCDSNFHHKIDIK